MSTDLVRTFDEALNVGKIFSRIEETYIENQMIVKYRFDKPEFAIVVQAVETIETLLRANQFLCPTFPGETLAIELSRKPYLTFKGRMDRGMSVSVCEVESEENDRYRDYFTDGPTIHPVRCSNNHLFERDLACIWRENKGDICPVGDHSIGNLTVTPADERDFAMHNRGFLRLVQEKELEKAKAQLANLHGRISVVVGRLLVRRTIPSFVFFGVSGTRIFYRGLEEVKGGTSIMSATLAKKAVEKTGTTVMKEVAEEVSQIALKKVAEKVSKAAVKEVAEEASQIALKKAAEKVSKAAVKKVVKGMGGSALKKVTVKVGEAAIKEVAEGVGETVTKKAVEELGKEAGKQVSKKAVETFGKIVPFVGVVFGAGFMVRRFWRGQIVKGFGELASGIAGCFPGYGTVISLGIDTALLGSDVVETVSSVCATQAALKKPSKIIIQFDPPSAYEILGIAPCETGLPNRKAIDTIFDQFHKLLELSLPGPATYIVDERLEVTKGVCASALEHTKEVIYQSRGWI